MFEESAECCAAVGLSPVVTTITAFLYLDKLPASYQDSTGAVSGGP